MTFQLNENTVSPRRYGSSTSFSVPSGSSGESPWKNTGAGGAFQFYGNTDSRVTFENNGQFNLGTGDFTVEWWQYGTADNQYPRPWAFGPWPDTQLGVSFEGNFILWCFGNSYAFPLEKPITKTSNHFAVVRSDSIFRIYQNGVEIGNQYNDSAFNLTYNLTLGYEGGAYNSQCFVGTLTNFNILNYAKYTGTFTPTQTALSIDPNSRLFVPATTATNWLEPYGDYIGTVQAGENTDWVDKSPFKFSGPNPLVTFPYPAVQYVSSYNMANMTSTFIFTDIYGGYWEARAWANSQPGCNDNNGNGGGRGGDGREYIQMNCGQPIYSYNCPDGGGSDGNGNCVQQYPAVQGTVRTYGANLCCCCQYCYPWNVPPGAVIYSYNPACWGDGNVYYYIDTTSSTCPYGGTLDGNGTCVY